MMILLMCWIGIFVGYLVAAAVIKVMSHRRLNRERIEVGLPTQPLRLRRERV